MNRLPDKRNLSPQLMFQQLAEAHPPQFAFAEAHLSFDDWKAAALPKVIATLGDFPSKVASNPEMVYEWQEDGLIKQRWLIDVSEFISAAVIVCRLPDLGRSKHPGILCWHGHGQFGKDAVMGIRSTPERQSDISRQNYDYGVKMAKAGFVTFAIDWIGAGDRNDSSKPHYFANIGGRDWCNIYYLHATMMGMTPLSINIQHGIVVTDFAIEHCSVDENRIGVMGLSGGGTMSLWSSLVDQRIKATEIICYLDSWKRFGFGDLNYCGMQVTPGLYKLVDLPDLQGLLAPHPLLIDIGIYDTCFQLDGAMAAYNQVSDIYRAAGAENCLELDSAPIEHGWCGEKSVDFFSRHLK